MVDTFPTFPSVTEPGSENVPGNPDSTALEMITAASDFLVVPCPLVLLAHRRVTKCLDGPCPNLRGFKRIDNKGRIELDFEVICASPVARPIVKINLEEE